jgi:hypothetical protein
LILREQCITKEEISIHEETKQREERGLYLKGKSSGHKASQPPLLVVIMITPMQTSTVPAQRIGVTISPRKYWERKATST